MGKQFTNNNKFRGTGNRNGKNDRKYNDKRDTKRKKLNETPDADQIPDHNDWSFYAASDEIAKDIASLPFNYLGGTPFRLKGSVINPDGTVKYELTDKPLPCVFNITYSTSIGVTELRTQGANMAAVQLYTYIRHANSGAKNYEAADVMMYILAMRDIYSEFFELKKILGCASLYNYYNHNLPDTILYAMHIEPDDLRANLAQYRGRLNLIAKKINSFAVPKYFKVFDRSTYIASYLFTDSNSIRGQFYNFKRGGYYTWSPVTETTGTSLQFTPYPWEIVTINTPQTVTFGERMNIIEDMIDALFLDEDALTMSGDILKAFSESELYNIMQTGEDYSVPITMDTDILSQIENSQAVNVNITDAASLQFDVTQSDQIIRFLPTMTIMGGNTSIDLDRTVLNSHKENPDYKDVLEWTRLITTGKQTTFPGEDEDATYTITSTGLELVWNYDVVVADPAGTVERTRIFSRPQLGTYGLTADNTKRLALLTAFDWHPFQYIFDPNATSGSLSLVGDIKVATTVDVTTLEKINDAAVYGALYGAGLYNSKN